MQRLVHWLEEGRGGRWARGLAVVLVVAVFSVLLVSKRYQGPDNESLLAQAVLARELAAGHGFSTPVWYPQAVATMEQARGWEPGAGARLPELYQAPGYPVVLAAAMAVLPESACAWLRAPPSRQAYREDFLLVGVALLLFWGTVGLAVTLAKAVFDARAAWLTAAGCLLSAGLWDSVFAADGRMLLAVLTLLTLHAVRRWERAGVRGQMLWSLVAGLLAAALFLTDYPAGLAGVPLLGYFAWRGRDRRREDYAAAPGWLSPLVFLAVFGVVVAPWIVRNVELTGMPLGLAGQELTWRAGDPSAEPASWRSAYSSETMPFSARKVINKGLDGLSEAARETFWSGGAAVFAAFFMASLCYRFRRSETNRLRWLAVGLVVTLLAGAPFFSSGELSLAPGAWLAPVIIVFGAGFFFVLLESTGAREASRRGLAVAFLLAVQAAPVGHWLLQPGVLAHYRFFPYAPPILHAVQRGLGEQIDPGRALMADIPAGWAWYGQGVVWGQPATARDFARIHERHPVGVLLLTPQRLDEPYFRQLVPREASASDGEPRWADVYRALAAGERLPAFFPLQTRERIWDNFVVLADPNARRSPSVSAP